MKRIEERYISLLTDFGLKAFRDVKNSIDTALEKGREEGKNSKAIQIAKRMLDVGCWHGYRNSYANNRFVKK